MWPSRCPLRRAAAHCAEPSNSLFVSLCVSPSNQEQINNLVNQVCGRAMLKSASSNGGVVVSRGGGADPCHALGHALSPAKASPAKRGPRKRPAATVEVSLARLSSTHIPKAAAVS